MYTEEFVTEITAAYNRSEKNLKKAAAGISAILDKDDMDYYFFGPYWWAVKALLRKYLKGDKWYLGEYFDQLTHDRAWHGTELRTISAAFHYHTEQIMKTPCHSLLIDGEEVPYTLWDEDAPV